MSYPLTNLGDYNIARNALKAVGGNWEILYNSIGTTAVAKAAPKILLKGGYIGVCIGAGVTGVIWAVCELRRLLKESKQLVEKEPSLKRVFAEAVEAEPQTVNTEHLDNFGEEVKGDTLIDSNE